MQIISILVNNEMNQDIKVMNQFLNLMESKTIFVLFQRYEENECYMGDSVYCSRKLHKFCYF